MSGREKPLRSEYLRGFSLSKYVPAVSCLSLQKGSARYITINLSLGGVASYLGRSGETSFFCGVIRASSLHWVGHAQVCPPRTGTIPIPFVKMNL